MKELGMRRVLKRSKPVFKRQDANKRKKVSDSYRKPKGYTSHAKMHMRGRIKPRSMGYRSPKKVRGLNSAGKKVVMINSINDLKSVKKGFVGVLSSKISSKKKYEMAKLIVKEKTEISNFNAEKFVEKIDASLKERKVKRKDFLKSRDKKAKVEKKEVKGKKKKESKSLEVREGTKKAVHKKQRSMKGTEKEAVKGVK